MPNPDRGTVEREGPDGRRRVQLRRRDWPTVYIEKRSLDSANVNLWAICDEATGAAWDRLFETPGAAWMYVATHNGVKP